MQLKSGCRDLGSWKSRSSRSCRLIRDFDGLGAPGEMCMECSLEMSLQEGKEELGSGGGEGGMSCEGKDERSGT